MFCYEVIPSYMFPLLNGVNVFCLASQRAAASVQNVFTNVFGGAMSNEGLGLLSIGLDWQYIESTSVLSVRQPRAFVNCFVHHHHSPMSLPLVQQGTQHPVTPYLNRLADSFAHSQFLDWYLALLCHSFGHLLLKLVGRQCSCSCPIHAHPNDLD
jgi:hypothetical protein